MAQAQAQAPRLTRAIGILQIVILVLVAVTALVHLQRGIGFLAGGPPRGPGGPGGGPGGPGGPPGGPGGGFNIFQLLPLPLPVLFLLNGVGYIVLGAALYLPQLRRFQPIVRWLLILFAALTIVMYFLIAGFRPNPLGFADKLIEVALIALLFIDGRRAASSADLVS